MKDFDNIVLSGTYYDDTTIKQMCACYKTNGFIIGALTGIAIYKVVKKIQKHNDKKNWYENTNN